MAGFRLGGALCAAVLCAALSAAPAAAGERSAAARLWQLRSGLNVAALACRGAEESAIVAGYNRLLVEHKAELAAAYEATVREFGDSADFDAAMTRMYNGYAQPAAQAALCANAGAVLAAFATEPAAALDPLAEQALALLEPVPVWTAIQVAAVLPAEPAPASTPLVALQVSSVVPAGPVPAPVAVASVALAETSVPAAQFRTAPPPVVVLGLADTLVQLAAVTPPPAEPMTQIAAMSITPAPAPSADPR